MMPLACARRNSDQVGPVRLGGGPRPARRNSLLIVVAPTRILSCPQLSLDADASPSWVLAGETQDQGDDLGIDRRSSWLPTPSVGPLPPHQLSVPAKERLRSDQERPPSDPRQEPARRSEQHPVQGLEFRPAPRRSTLS